jgi:hypothetical protein
LPDGYWKTIPGELFLIPYEKIISINVIHLSPAEQSSSEIAQTAVDELGPDTATQVEPLSEEYLVNKAGERLAWLTSWSDGSWVLTTMMGDTEDHVYQSREEATRAWADRYDPETGLPL